MPIHFSLLQWSVGCLVLGTLLALFLIIRSWIKKRARFYKDTLEDFYTDWYLWAIGRDEYRQHTFSHSRSAGLCFNLRQYLTKTGIGNVETQKEFSDLLKETFVSEGLNKIHPFDVTFEYIKSMTAHKNERRLKWVKAHALRRLLELDLQAFCEDWYLWATDNNDLRKCAFAYSEKHGLCYSLYTFSRNTQLLTSYKSVDSYMDEAFKSLGTWMAYPFNSDALSLAQPSLSVDSYDKEIDKRTNPKRLEWAKTYALRNPKSVILSINAK